VDDTDISSSTTPISFKRISRRISSKRFDFLTSERQLLIDIAKKCCSLECLSKFGKKMLKQVRIQYFSLNGEEENIFLADRLQLRRFINKESLF
jgi:hypothetical protein